MSCAPEITIHRSITKALKIFDADRFRWLDEATSLGPVVGLRLGPVRTWVVTDPELARTMLVTDGASWSRPPAVRVPIRVGVGENLFTQTDRQWARLQPLIAPAFRKKALEPRLLEMQALIDSDVGSLPYDTPVDLELAMGRISLRLAAWVLLGDELDPDRADEIAHHQRDLVSWVGRRLGETTGFLPFAPGARGRAMRRHQSTLNAYADEVIARARRTRPSDDVLGALLGARLRGKPLTDAQLRGHVLGLFLAGNETTAAALSWLLVHASQNPGAWSQLRDDPERGTSGFLTESMRVTPAVWGIPRTPIRPGVALRAGATTTRVRRGQLATIYLRGINRGSERWIDPMRFDPSRHDVSDVDAKRSLIPFGLGPRGCIGQHLALAELHAVVPALARHGEITVDAPAVEDPSFALRVRGGLRGTFTRSSG
jgi:Cytochrome P450